MTTEERMHLNEAQILLAMVDEADLPATVREHLLRCEVCAEEKKRVENGLARMTRTARQVTPKPLRKPSLESAVPRSIRWLPWGWRYGFSASIAVAAVLIIAFGALFSDSTRESTAYLTDRETIEDEQLMAEIARLEEDSFPSLYMEISGSSETDPRRGPVDDDSVKGTETDETDVPDSRNARVS